MGPLVVPQEHKTASFPNFQRCVKTACGLALVASLCSHPGSHWTRMALSCLQPFSGTHSGHEGQQTKQHTTALTLLHLGLQQQQKQTHTVGGGAAAMQSKEVCACAKQHLPCSCLPETVAEVVTQPLSRVTPCFTAILSIRPHSWHTRPWETGEKQHRTCSRLRSETSRDQNPTAPQTLRPVHCFDLCCTSATKKTPWGPHH